MKYSAVFLLLAIIGGFILIYSLNYRPVINWQALQPVIDQKNITTQTGTTNLLVELYRQGQLVNYLDKQSLILFLIGIFLLFFGALGSIHLLIDKLFYKKFYQNPNLILAIRRSLVVGAVPVVILVLGLYNYSNPPVILLVLLVAACIELIGVTLPSKKPETLENEQNKETK